MSTTNDAVEMIDYLKSMLEVSPALTIAQLLKDAACVFGTEAAPDLPAPSINRVWSVENGEESVDSWGGRVWRIRDLRAAVAGQPMFDLPLGLIPLRHFEFACPDIVEFARHMKHVLEVDVDDPVIMDEYGWVMDGRHRIVRALMDGKEAVRCVKLPDGLTPSFYKNDSK